MSDPKSADLQSKHHVKFTSFQSKNRRVSALGTSIPLVLFTIDAIPYATWALVNHSVSTAIAMVQ